MTDTITQSGFFDWLMQMLRDIAGTRTPFFNGVMSGVTILGEEMAFIVIGLILFWCFDKKYGYRFLFMYVAGNFLNQLLKSIFMIPRPWVIDEDFEIVEAAREGASGWSFPSGHTQSAVLLYGGLSRRVKKWWGYLIAAVLILLIGYSRMYLGVHTLLDVGVSLITGLLLIAFTEALFDRIGDGVKPFTIACAVLAVLCIGLIIFTKTLPESETYNDQVKGAYMLFGTTFGLLAGGYIEKRFINFDPKSKWWVQIIKVVVGLALVLALRVGLKKLLGLISSDSSMDAIRYFAMSFFALGVYPLFFNLFRKRDKKPE
ncbi:MAG: phosphatase PAP2 family protein [Clostridia bacterium]|nr:phosphatase PAP2 family protein [Clostridia bacterium]